MSKNNGEDQKEDDDVLSTIIQESITNGRRRETHDAKYDDKTGRRILSLSLGTTISAPFDHHWELSPHIQRLDALESLTVTFCKRLPRELVSLRKLKKLTLIGCKRFEVFPSSDFFREMDRCTMLQELRIVGIVPMIPPYIISQIAPLKHLKVLQFSFHGNSIEEEELFLREVIRPDIRFTSSLTELILSRCHISDDGFRFLLLDVVPRYPNLKSLSLCNNQIKSLRRTIAVAAESTATTTIETTDFIPSSQQPQLTRQFTFSHLEELVLSDNPVWEQNPRMISSTASFDKNEIVEEKKREERHCLEKFLTYRAVRLGYLGYRFERSLLWSPSIQHWLDINKCGRYLIDQGTSNQQHQNQHQMPSYNTKTSASTNSTSNSNTIPLALWALVLEKTNTHFSKIEPIGTESSTARCANVLYYFARNGPALAGRNNFFGRKQL
jgi:hypothetical protein